MTNSSPVSNTTVADQKSAFGSTLFALSFMGGVIWNLTILFLLTGAFGWIGSFACIGLGLYRFKDLSGVAQSGDAIELFMEEMEGLDEFKLTIRDAEWETRNL